MSVVRVFETASWLKYSDDGHVASPAPISGSQLISMPKNRLSAFSAAFGDGGIHTQWPKIIGKLFIWPSLWPAAFALRGRLRSLRG